MLTKANFSPIQPQVGGWSTLKISNQIRVAGQTLQRFRQLANITAEFKPHMGDTFQVTKIGKMSNRGQIIGEFGDVPVGSFSSTYTQVTAQWISNSIELSQEADFHSELSVVDAALITLTNEANEALDLFAAEPYRQCDIVYTPTGGMGNKTFAWSENGVPAAVASRNLTTWDLRNINDQMRVRYKAPPYEKGKYLSVMSNRALRGIREDTEFVDIQKYNAPAKLLNFEVGEIENFRILEETNALDNNLGGGACGEAIFIGQDAVVGVETYPLEIQAAVIDSWGRFRAIRYVTRIGYARNWTWATEQNARIVRVGSL